ncbi:MAG: DEAD/DEAH box helicase family protein [Patescibacteria group bacterium]|nr:DEAD/DEAH box helicase family protein [Patescibacteria group bacterium]
METFYSLNENSKSNVNAISSRLSLRKPQRESLQILAHVLELCPPEKNTNLEDYLSKLQNIYPAVKSFDRDFFSLCFALATGVGKTRLMGAFIALLYKQYNVRNFFVLAPNLTIYNKLINDFSPQSPKYVLNGLQEFANNGPLLITGDTYDNGVISGSLNPDEVTINIFNISKINAEVRGGNVPKFKRLREYLGQSYFDYLSNLSDLVMIMDESHRYRGSAGFNAINELNPMLGLELTATPQVENGGVAERFNNIIYDYPLANAIADGFVKEPAVATREDFNPNNYSDEEIEDLKIRDGVLVHENTKIELATFALNHNLPVIKPFILIVTKDTTHADQIVERIKRDDFFGGRYKEKVITVHSNQKGSESDETIARLIAVEDKNEPTEIVVHVDKLKEGWDVTNLYTIIPLRKANSTTLVEQSIGRGLRLPYGKKMGVPSVDRLTIIAHDKFNEIINESKKPDSIIRAVVKIGVDVSLSGKKLVSVATTSVEKLIGQPAQPSVNDGEVFIKPQESPPLFKSKTEQIIVSLTLDAIKDSETRVKDIHSLDSLNNNDIREAITKKVELAYKSEFTSRQMEIAETVIEPDFDAIVKETLKSYSFHNITVPRISVRPRGNVTTGFNNFDLDVSAINQQPVDQDILIEHLLSNKRDSIHASLSFSTEQRIEDYIVRNLIDFDDISYDDHADVLYKLSGQLIDKLRGYLASEDDVLNVVQYNQKQFATFIHSQMQKHWWQKADDGYEVIVSKSYQVFKDPTFTIDGNENVRDVFQHLLTGEKDRISSMVFGGFKRCCYTLQKFGSDSERMFACILEKDFDVIKWFKPKSDQFSISYRNTDGVIANYEPDFIVETNDCKYIFEPKQSNTMNDENVKNKKSAAIEWCKNATNYELSIGGKRWAYVLIPHSAITNSATIKGLVNQFS